MLSHVDNKNKPTMVDVSAKGVSVRWARAQSKLKLTKEIISELDNGEITTKKGPVFATAIIAGTMAAKKTSDLIPFCHPIALESVKINIKVLNETQIIIDSIVKTSNKTGVEMEALVAVNIAALTVYDMCKAMSQKIEILDSYLLEKSGGKTDYKRSSQ